MYQEVQGRNKYTLAKCKVTLGYIECFKFEIVNILVCKQKNNK